MLSSAHFEVLQTFSNFIFLHNNHNFLVFCQKTHWQYNKEKYLCWVCRYWPSSMIKLFYKYQWKEGIKIQNSVAEYYLLCYYFEDSCHQKTYIPSENQCKWNFSNKSVLFFWMPLLSSPSFSCTIFSVFDHLNPILEKKITRYRSHSSDQIRLTRINMKP